MARRFGCSRERVRQVISRLGIVVVRAPPRRCRKCGTSIAAQNRTGLCGKCWQRPVRVLVTLTCLNCGKQFLRRRKDYNDWLRRAVVRGRAGPICSRGCRSAVPVSCTWCGDDLGMRYPSNISKARHSYCPAPSRCASEAHKALRNSYWRFLSADLLPMRDHLSEIAALRDLTREQLGLPARVRHHDSATMARGEQGNCSWCGEDLGIRYPGNRGNSGLSFCPTPKRCVIEAQKALNNAYWRFLSADLLPMRDHITGVASLNNSIRKRVVLTAPMAWGRNDPVEPSARRSERRRQFLSRVAALDASILEPAGSGPENVSKNDV